MNIIQTIPRIDCKAFAKCGKKSLSHCRRYKLTDEECSVCGEWYGVHRFYPRTLKRGEKVYFTFSSECRRCKSLKASVYQRNKQQLKIE
ncbi:hypothetical protein [Bacteroides fragilis]|uniref:hypothetical protein n=1 Tax=Bacteroides fragilis TaxID=817 RepID=UPI001CE0B049|nr:hypothetical protein [Bacteroides fragilis]MCA5612487.1 hypothetical protein [Bacteroides fragilis]MCZ2586036.1 hypothetical protein [Bacteroides fragilis]